VNRDAIGRCVEHDPLEFEEKDDVHAASRDFLEKVQVVCLSNPTCCQCLVYQVLAKDQAQRLTMLEEIKAHAFFCDMYVLTSLPIIPPILTLLLRQ
jgi:hypothetical protein